MKRIAVVAVVFCLLAGVATAQQSKPPDSSTSPQRTETPQARAADVKTLDGILAALYDVISGPAAQKRDWARFRSLFVPDARLMPTGGPSGKIGVRMLSVDDYISRAEPVMEKEGFFESEVSRRTEQFANITHVWSTYESRHKAGDKPFARGINSIQLMNDGERWWIIDVLWQGESSEHSLPEKYLEKGTH